jgi:hypothetical protein
MEAKQRVSAPRRSQLAISTARRDAERDLPLSKTPEGAIVAPQPPGIRGMSGKSSPAVPMAFIHLLGDVERCALRRAMRGGPAQSTLRG